ncbi:hypothetical protein RF11_13334 [Thelohanellus kitauei]|uniref:Uncharacterized protein n=1 Tax=Thelohanellus kitauei TaxID=669202 RepID=A0A0C2N413_THEKT|nr:hypothetical protein RF11_13334 [Thelohanellus kitauei]
MGSPAEMVLGRRPRCTLNYLKPLDSANIDKALTKQKYYHDTGNNTTDSSYQIEGEGKTIRKHADELQISFPEHTTTLPVRTRRSTRFHNIQSDSQKKKGAK